MTEACYHCGEPIPKNCEYEVEILGEVRRMCCPGCHAVANTIVASGLTSYYEFRTEKADRADLVPEALQTLQHYDLEEVQQDFVIGSEQNKEVTLSLEGVTCAACAWLIEKKLYELTGVVKVIVNTTTHRAVIGWKNDTVALSKILQAIHSLGYQAAPFAADSQEQHYHRTMKQYLYRIGIAGLATMQVMMLAVALYFEVFSDLDEAFRHYFRWVSLVFATPVLLYSALPFYLNAWRNIKARSLGMDVPVSIALLLAYFASLFATVKGTGEVFFESVAMFTFFLLLGRFLEMRVRRQAAAASANLLKLIPTIATLVNGDEIAAKLLKAGDRVRVLPGEAIPADAVLVSGETEVDEAMLSGESAPVKKYIGDLVYAGTINGDANIECEIQRDIKHSMINTIVRLQDEAQQSKPQIAELADKVARYFVVGILTISAATWLYWHGERPDDAFWIMLSVLVATCPCALSLATPTALTCGTSQMSKQGLLVRKSHVIETLCHVNHVILDKTGTLTEGKVTLARTLCFSQETEQAALRIAAGLEQYANHPIARAFSPFFDASLHFEDVTNHIGEGLEGVIDQQQWRIGTWHFACQGDCPNPDVQVWLSCNRELVAGFELEDPIREESPAFIRALHDKGVTVTMLTGDQSRTAEQVAHLLGIDRVQSGMSPEEKFRYLKSLPDSEITLMIGDGVNDAPTLAGAHLSVAMGGGTDIAKSSADMVLLGDQLAKVIGAKEIATRTRDIIWQNLLWSLGYNAVILPLAVMGMVAPYIAVFGMSASSLIVVTNSLRLMK
ncbi:heavy metal translocating P-type ATPase [Thaumasiovibrio subtropicus]|uniref:heavy metal translocating P-type ATPase n=1 Tax=Thaumasiovibrio subtropicus TaxID=1891207 RepID=UPI000B359FD8|nr:heavy metal translocating P-type ATPase [Thaumasiovibrio subtropicus]